MRPSRMIAAFGAATLALALTGCGGDAQPNHETTSSASAEKGTQADHLTITDPWVKAADSGATAVFGVLTNHGDQEVVLTSASSDIATSMQLHETVKRADGALVMQETDGGFVIAPHATRDLAPGGDHIMAMGLDRALQPGESVRVVLTLGDGSTVDVDATVKPFSGAQEEYMGDGHSGDH